MFGFSFLRIERNAENWVPLFAYVNLVFMGYSKHFSIHCGALLISPHVLFVVVSVVYSVAYSVLSRNMVSWSHGWK